MEDVTQALSQAAPPEQTPLPEALQAPTKPASARFMLSLALPQVVLYMCFTGIGGLLLPVQVTAIDPAHKVANLGLIATVGAILALVGNPLAGALSDQTTSRFGRRRPWIFIGALACVGALALLLTAHSILTLLIGWAMFQLAANCALAPLAAIIPDRVPESQRGAVSALVGLGLPGGSILGAIVVGQVLKVPQTSYMTLIAVVVLGMFPFCFLLRDHALPKAYQAHFNALDFIKQFWINPRKYPDFGWAWLTRFLAILAYSLGTGYTLYYLQDEVKVAAGDLVQKASLVNIIATVTGILFIGVSGFLSDRFKRRKIFVVISGIILAASLLLFGFLPIWNVVLLGAALIGVGFGIYIAIDGALVTQVLPSANSRGKDLGVINIANTLPQSIAPGVAAFVIGASHNYLLLFILAAVVALLSGVLIQFIKSVR